MRTPILLIFLFGFSIIYDAEALPAKHEPADNSIYGIQHCINMTPENEAKINAITDKLSDYLYNLTMEHEVFDIRLLKIVIEGHSEDEVDEKDTQVQLVVNDCAQPYELVDAEDTQAAFDKEDVNEETIEIEFVEPVEEDLSESIVTEAVDNSSDQVSDLPDVTTNDEHTDTKNSVATNATSNGESIVFANQTTTTNLNQSDYSTDNVKPGKSRINTETIPLSSAANYDVPGPVLVRLDLDETGKKLVRATQAKRGEHVPLLLYVQKVLNNVQYLFGN